MKARCSSPPIAHDFENLLDHLIILGKGEILLNRSLDEISNRLLFCPYGHSAGRKHLQRRESIGLFLHHSQRGRRGEHTDIELLYKAVLQQPEKIQSMFQ